MKVFLDIGAHHGQSIEPALSPKYGFKRIVAFEPVLANADYIRNRYSDPRVEVCAFGLWNRTAEAKIYAPGSPGASLFQDKAQEESHEICKFVRASDWLKENLKPEDRAVLKINVEGAECDIIDDLIDTRLMDRIEFMFLAFDVEKIPSQAHRSAETRSRLQQIRFNRYFAWDGFFRPRPQSRWDFVVRGGNQAQFLRHWFDAYGIDDQRGPLNEVREYLFEARGAFDRGRKMIDGAVRRRLSNLIVGR